MHQVVSYLLAQINAYEKKKSIRAKIRTKDKCRNAKIFAKQMRGQQLEHELMFLFFLFSSGTSNSMIVKRFSAARFLEGRRHQVSEGRPTSIAEAKKKKHSTLLLDAETQGRKAGFLVPTGIPRVSDLH
jgi:hypothetical protein